MLYGIVVSHELVVSVANLGALPGGIAVGNAWEVDVGVDVSSDEVEDIVEAEKIALANFSSPVAGSALVAGEKLNDQSGNFEESIEERASNDTSPIFSDQSSHGSVPVGWIFAPVPVDSQSRHAEVD